MDDMDRARDRAKDKAKAKDMVETVTEDVIITDNGTTDITNKTKVEMGMLNLLPRLQVVRGTHRQDLELL